MLTRALEVSNYSADPSTKVGCVVVRGHEIVAEGYNRFPTPMIESAEMLNDRPTKYKYMVHAEVAAISGMDVAGCTVYVTHMPCVGCAGKLAAAGVQSVVIIDRPSDARWQEQHEQAERLLAAHGITVVHQ
jgi:dCMP deaminase